MTVDASPAEPTPRLLPRILARVMGGIVIMGAGGFLTIAAP